MVNIVAAVKAWLICAFLHVTLGLFVVKAYGSFSQGFITTATVDMNNI